MNDEMIEILGWMMTALAVGGVLLNNRMDRNCFWLWMISNAVTAVIHIYVGVWSLAVRDTVFFALAIWGLRTWKQKQRKIEFDRTVGNQTMSKLLDQNVQLLKMLQTAKKR